MCWQQRVGWVGEGSGGKAGTSCLHTLPLPSLGNAANTHYFTKNVKSLFGLSPMDITVQCSDLPSVAQLSEVRLETSNLILSGMRLEDN